MQEIDIVRNEAKNSKKAKDSKYIVKSVFLGTKELKDIIWKIAENRAIRIEQLRE